MTDLAPPYTRSKHAPSNCKRCRCFEFLDDRHRRPKIYSGKEICIACQHIARHHVWSDIEPDEIDFSPLGNPGSPIFRKYEFSEKDVNSSPMWRHSARKAREKMNELAGSKVRGISPSAMVSTITEDRKDEEEKETRKETVEEEEEEGTEEQEINELEKEDQEEMMGGEEQEGQEEESWNSEEEEEVEEELDIDISKFCSSPPIISPVISTPGPIGGRVTVAKLYDYVVERGDYTDHIQGRLLRRIAENKRLLKELCLGFVSAKEEMKGAKRMIDEIAGNYWSERPNKRPKGGLTPDARRNTPEVSSAAMGVGVEGAQGVRSVPKRSNLEEIARDDKRVDTTRLVKGRNEAEEPVALKTPPIEVEKSATKIPLRNGGFKVITSPVLEAGYGVEETDEEEDGFVEESTEEDIEEGRDRDSGDNGSETIGSDDEDAESDEQEEEKNEEEEQEEEEQDREEEQEDEEEGQGGEELEEYEESTEEDSYIDPNEIYINRYRNRPSVQLYSGNLPLMTPIKEETPYASSEGQSLSPPTKGRSFRKRVAFSSDKVAPKSSYLQMLPNELLSKPQRASPLRKQNDIGGGHKNGVEEETSILKDKTTRTPSNKGALESIILNDKARGAKQAGSGSSRGQRSIKEEEVFKDSASSSSERTHRANVSQGIDILLPVLNSSSPCESLTGKLFLDELYDQAIEQDTLPNSSTAKRNLADVYSSGESSEILDVLQLMVEDTPRKRKKKPKGKKKWARVGII